jgi:hypothetical protein
MLISTNVSAPQCSYESQAQTLIRNASSEEAGLVLTALETLVAPSEQPTFPQGIPESWMGLLHSIHQMTPSQRPQTVVRIREVVERVFADHNAVSSPCCFENLSSYVLMQVVGFLPLASQVSFAKTARIGRESVQSWRVLQNNPFLNTPRLGNLLRYFCLSVPSWGQPEASAPWREELIKRVLPPLLGTFQNSYGLSVGEKERLRGYSVPQIASEPRLLYTLLQANYNLSLVGFCEAVSGSQRCEPTIEQKAEAAAAFFRMNREVIRRIEVGGIPAHLNCITCIPNEIFDLLNLEQLFIVCSRLLTLHPAIGNLSTLTGLRLGGNLLCGLPDSVGRLSRLRELFIEHNPTCSLPPSLASLPSLRVLSLDSALYDKLPLSFRRSPSLKIYDEHGSCLSFSEDQSFSLHRSL